MRRHSLADPACTHVAFSRTILMIRAAINHLLRSRGWEVRKLSAETDPLFHLVKVLQFASIDLVIDVGANTGQFAQGIRDFGFKGDIVSLEPLSTAHATLLSQSAQDPRWHVHARTAIGDEDGELEINIAGNSLSSSILPMLATHATAAHDSTYIARERTAVARLDAVALEYIKDDARCFVKIDTQGYERQVLDGAPETLRKARGVMCELSLLHLYEGQCLWDDLRSRLQAEGFTLWALQPGFTDPRSGRTLQVDGIFLREPL
jgi:FkbM family methyltransferase